MGFCRSGRRRFIRNSARRIFQNRCRGLFVAVFAALIPIGILGELVNIGTLLAFVIVCVGVWILRVRRPGMARPFKTPWVPVVPIMGILISAGLMAALPGDTWLRLIIWLAIGMVIYFGYSRKHSRVQKFRNSPGDCFDPKISPEILRLAQDEYVVRLCPRVTPLAVESWLTMQSRYRPNVEFQGYSRLGVECGRLSASQ